MTTLPNRNTIAGVGASYGQVRSALGDLRDFLSESLGTSGTSPVIDGAILSNTTSLAIGVDTPGTSAQILGSLSVTATGATINPGDGGMYLTGKQLFSSQLGSKIDFLAPSGDPLSIGRQTNSLYARVKTTGSFNLYAGGTHSDTPNTAGTGGSELLRVSPTEFLYKNQTVYHSGNGVFIRKDTADTALEKITFDKGARFRSVVELGDSSVFSTLEFLFPGAGTKIKLYPDTGENFQIGVQNASVFVRTPENFTVYSGGVFSPNPQTPGAGGTQLLNVGINTMTYKNQTVYHTGNSDFVTKKSVARPGVDVVYNSSADDGNYFVGQFNARADNRMWLVSNAGGCRVAYADGADTSTYSAFRAGTDRPLMFETSPLRPGATRLWIGNQDNTIYSEMHFNGSRMQFIARNTDGTSYETYVNRAETCDRASTINGQGIDDGTIRYFEISMGTGSVSGTILANVWGVHPYAFSSPTIAGVSGNNITYCVGIGAHANSGAPTKAWRGLNTTGTVFVTGSAVTWEYITATGDPYIWVHSDKQGNIIGTWDAEDPYDKDQPDNNPLVTIPDTYRVQIPSIEEFGVVLNRFIQKNNPTFKDSFEETLKNYASRRNLMKDYNKGMDLREFVYDLPGDEQKQNWRVQAVIRALTVQISETKTMSIQELISLMYKVDKKGKLHLK